MLLHTVKTEISIIDPVIIRYLEECLSCFRRNLLLSSAVMLGCASEKAVLLLIETFGATLQGAQKTAFEKETNTFIISRKYKSGHVLSLYLNHCRIILVITLKALYTTHLTLSAPLEMMQVILQEI